MGRCGVKICGTTSLEDARLAAEAGADYFGVVVETDFSPRSLSIEQAVPLFTEPAIPAVALVFRMEPDRVRELIKTLQPHAVQFLNLVDLDFIRVLKEEFPAVELWQSVHLPEAGQAVDFEAFQQTVKDYVASGIDLLIFDTVAVLNGVAKFGGTGQVSDWELVKSLIDQVDTEIPIWLAGGVNPDNVGQAVTTVHPSGVDLCSDPDKVRCLVTNARAAC
jgi:phosphoribosylanthranilate isomerase